MSEAGAAGQLALESIRPGANAYGAHMLAVSAQGNYLYGYWCGPDQGGSRRYGRWVLARDEPGLEAAKRLLEAMRQPIALSPSPAG